MIKENEILYLTTKQVQSRLLSSDEMYKVKPFLQDNPDTKLIILESGVTPIVLKILHKKGYIVLDEIPQSLAHILKEYFLNKNIELILFIIAENLSNHDYITKDYYIENGGNDKVKFVIFNHQIDIHLRSFLYAHSIKYKVINLPSSTIKQLKELELI